MNSPAASSSNDEFFRLRLRGVSSRSADEDIVAARIDEIKAGSRFRIARFGAQV
jgi:hypothetical protein